MKSVDGARLLDVERLARGRALAASTSSTRLHGVARRERLRGGAAQVAGADDRNCRS